MNFSPNNLLFKVVKAEDKIENDGSMALKCTVVITSTLFSKAKQKEYKLREKYFGVKLLGEQSKLDELKDKLADVEAKVNENKQRDKSERAKNVPTYPYVRIYCNSISFNNYYFAAAKKSTLVIQMDEWDFKKKSIKVPKSELKDVPNTKLEAENKKLKDENVLLRAKLKRLAKINYSNEKEAIKKAEDNLDLRFNEGNENFMI